MQHVRVINSESRLKLMYGRANSMLGVVCGDWRDERV